MFVAVAEDVTVTRGVMVMVVKAEVENDSASPSVLLLTMPLGVKGR